MAHLSVCWESILHANRAASKRRTCLVRRRAGLPSRTECCPADRAGSRRRAARTAPPPWHRYPRRVRSRWTTRRRGSTGAPDAPSDSCCVRRRRTRSLRPWPGTASMLMAMVRAVSSAAVVRSIPHAFNELAPYCSRPAVFGGGALVIRVGEQLLEQLLVHLAGRGPSAPSRSKGGASWSMIMLPGPVSNATTSSGVRRPESR